MSGANNNQPNRKRPRSEANDGENAEEEMRRRLQSSQSSLFQPQVLQRLARNGKYQQYHK